MVRRRVLVDGYFLGKPYGFGRFILELCRALGSRASDLELIVAVPSRIKIESLPAYHYLTWHTVPDANFMLWEQVMVPRLAHKLGCGVIHFPYNTKAVFTGRVRTVVTVHDLIFLTEVVRLQPLKAWLGSQYSKCIFKLATGGSSVIVSVSDTTRRALALLGMQATTVYNTVDGLLAVLPEIREVPNKRYILHRGGHQSHRNTERVIHSFLRIRPKIPDVELRIVGVPDGAKRWGTRDDQSIRYLPRLTDAELAACYADSACVVAVSLKEGFGLPIIEGFGFGTPVITSKLDPMREVAGGAALLVDPFSLDSIGDAIVSLVHDGPLAQSLVEKGFARLAAFRSECVAEQMLQIYSSALGDPNGRGRPTTNQRKKTDTYSRRSQGRGPLGRG